MEGGLSFWAGPCQLSQMSGSCEPNGELAWTPQLGARQPVPSLLLSPSGAHFLHLHSTGQGDHTVPFCAEDLGLLSPVGAVEQRLLLGGRVFPSVLEGLATSRRPAWASAIPQRWTESKPGPGHPSWATAQSPKH